MNKENVDGLFVVLLTRYGRHHQKQLILSFCEQLEILLSEDAIDLVE